MAPNGSSTGPIIQFPSIGTQKENNQIMVVSSYSNFDRLAHGPRGTEASHCLYVYKFLPSDGSMVLLSIAGDSSEILNPAFSRFHPRLNVLYTCTEDIEENGLIVAFRIDRNGGLTKMGEVDAGGTSTCYITLDRDERNLIAVNYWNSTLVTIPICKNTGKFTGGLHHKYDPKAGRDMVASGKRFGGVNHSNNDDSTIKQRQADPHSHALVLDPYVGCIAFVPCLGKDLIREFFFDKVNGKVEVELNTLPSGKFTGMPDGPRYLEFHPEHNTMYVVNELSSTIAVFSVNKELIHTIDNAVKSGEGIDKFYKKSTLTLIQSIETIPIAFPKKLNTCGRLCLHKSGRFVLVSNRGHQSIAILRVKECGPNRGQLATIGYFHTRGETPRHFKFDESGQYLIVANQDSDNLAIFNFNQCSGEIKFTGNEYVVPSPNFVCCCSLHEEEVLGVPSPVSTDGSDSVSESNSSISTIGMNSKKRLEEELSRALAEIDRLRTHISMFSS